MLNLTKMLFDFMSLFLIKFSPSNNLLLFSFTKISVCKRLKTYEVQYISRDKAAPGVGQLFLCSVYTHSCADIIKTHFLNSTQMPTTSKHISSAQTSPLNCPRLMPLSSELTLLFAHTPCSSSQCTAFLFHLNIPYSPSYLS